MYITFLPFNAIAIKAHCMLLRFPQAISRVFVLTLLVFAGEMHIVPPIHVLHKEVVHYVARLRRH